MQRGKLHGSHSEDMTFISQLCLLRKEPFAAGSVKSCPLLTSQEVLCSFSQPIISTIPQGGGGLQGSPVADGKKISTAGKDTEQHDREDNSAERLPQNDFFSFFFFFLTKSPACWPDSPPVHWD